MSRHQSLSRQEYWTICMKWYFKRLSDHNVHSLCSFLVQYWLSTESKISQVTDRKYENSNDNKQKLNRIPNKSPDNSNTTSKLPGHFYTTAKEDIKKSTELQIRDRSNGSNKNLSELDLRFKKPSGYLTVKGPGFGRNQTLSNEKKTRP